MLYHDVILSIKVSCIYQLDVRRRSQRVFESIFISTHIREI